MSTTLTRQDGPTEAMNAIHRALPLELMRCGLDSAKTAVWWHSKQVSLL